MKIVFAGAGGYAAALLDYLNDLPVHLKRTVIGYISNTISTHPAFSELKWLGPDFTRADLTNTAVMVGIGDGQKRKAVFEEVRYAGGTVVGLIHPTAYVANSARVHPTAILGPLTFVDSGASIGRGVATTGMNTIGHDSEISDYVQFSPFASTMGFAKIGECAFLAPYASVSPKVCIGARSKLSSGTIATTDAPDGSLIVGNPGRGRVMFR